MPKKKKTWSQLKKETIARKKEKESESLCRKCGTCCHIKIGLSDGSYIVHPYVTCPYLSSDNICTIYEKRHAAANPKICFTYEEMISKDYILAEGCPYTELRQGYKAARRVTAYEFDDIIARELEMGNFNVLLADRVF
jgi:uncharacterized cysteine cluster protein YcgN (CxxCxxCC family)